MATGTDLCRRRAQLSLRIQLGAILSPWFGVLLLELGLGSEKALAARGGRDTKSLLTSEEPWEAVTMAITIGSAQLSLCRRLSIARFNFKGGERGQE